MYLAMAHQSICPRNWTFAQVPSASLPSDEDDNEENEKLTWSKCSQFPTEIHLELRANGTIKDWNQGRVEHDIQCECDKSTLTFVMSHFFI